MDESLSFGLNLFLEHMKKLLFIAVLALFGFGLYAQKSFGHLVIGLESGFDVAQFSKGLKARSLPALQLEASLGPVSIGVGIGRKSYREYEYSTYTGETTWREENGALKMFYLHNIHTFKPAYWIIPVKINYRVHKCDCVYLHAGIIFEKVDLGRPDIITFQGAEFDQKVGEGLERGQLIAPRTRSYEFGIGFNVFKRDYFRLTARPTLAYTESPDLYPLEKGVPDFLPTLRFTFAAQFALWRERVAD